LGPDLTGTRSALFLPASNPRAIARARGSGADFIILDLEDAVKAADKTAARAAAVEAVAEPWPMPVAIRVNGTGSEWHQADVRAVAASAAGLALLPRAASGGQARDVREAIGKPLLAMIETARGILALADIAPEVSGLIAGTNDLAADLRLPPDAGRGPLQTALQTIVLVGRAHRLPILDGVFNRLDDADGFAAEAADSRRLGFDGKSLIHPDQIEPCHRAFAPTDQELDRARRLVAAATGGAERFDGAMIEGMHVAAARRLLDRACG
jgi:citrate lyase subunit beta/citryl-CoA lyase